jgi:probable selenium-dependent hydroxylase accessory protein YqeC
VGGGGKTSAVRLLAAERARAGGAVLVTTTTAMRARELAAVGASVVEDRDTALRAGVARALAGSSVVGVARARAAGGKVIGLSPAAVDALWAAGVVDHVIVEADGARGLSLKAFGHDEPQVPGAASVIVQTAGLDALGRPLDEQHAHRAAGLAAAAGVPVGSTITIEVFVRGLHAQLRRLRAGWPGTRIVTLLNKTDACAGAAADGVAAALLAPASAGLISRPPHRVVLASLVHGRFLVVVGG